MKEQSNNPNPVLDPARLADEAVLTLSSLERDSEVPRETLRAGIQLCEYLIRLLEELRTPEAEEKQWAFHAIRDDVKALRESDIDIGTARTKTEEVKRWIHDLIDDPSSHDREEIQSIKEHLMRITMPIWQERTSQFRERKMKRSLIIHG